MNGVALRTSIPPDRSLPFSHVTAGTLLRAFAKHKDFRHHSEVQQAARLLKSRFLKFDAYYGHNGVEYWTKFQYPFWWTDALSSLDLLQKMGFNANDADIEKRHPLVH